MVHKGLSEYFDAELSPIIAMDFLLLFMRVLHIVLGVFWAGTVLFNTFYLVPAFRDAGPDAAKVAGALMRRRLFDVLPIAAGLTIISGLWLYWQASLGFQPAYMGSSGGMTYGIGAVTAIVALALGLAIMRPSMLKAAELTQRAASATPSERDAQLAEAQRLRTRGANAGMVIALLLLVTVVTMAVGRYV